MCRSWLKMEDRITGGRAEQHSCGQLNQRSYVPASVQRYCACAPCGWHPEDNAMPSQESGVQGRNSYAIKIRTQQQKQEQFAFSEFEVRSDFTREQQRIGAELGIQPFKVCPQQIRKCNEQVQSDIGEIESFVVIRKEQQEHEFAQSVFELEGEQPAAD